MTKTHKKYLLGIDIGATNVKAGIVSAKGELLHQTSFPTNVRDGKDAVIHTITEQVRHFCAHHNVHTNELIAAGIGAPGPLDYKTGILYFAPNLPGWHNVQLAKIFTQKLKTDTFLENDANCAAWGEHWAGAAIDAQSFVMYTLGTGIGGGIIIENRILHGRDGAAAELGHVIVVPDGEACGCGSRGCLEAYASAPSIIRRYKSALRWEVGISATILDQSISAEEIVTKAIEGDVLCKKIIEGTGKYLGRSIAGILNIFNPEMVIIGGGVSNAGPILFEPIKNEVNKLALEIARRKINITQAKLGTFAGVIGAAGCALTISETSA